jgi:hypothetical protein
MATLLRLLRKLSTAAHAVPPDTAVSVETTVIMLMATHSIWPRMAPSANCGWNRPNFKQTHYLAAASLYQRRFLP